MANQNEFDLIVVGAGIVGLATAWQASKLHPTFKIALIEKESDVSKHQTGNNSGVMHSGLYYAPGSLKAKNCIDGYNMLIAFAKEHNIPFDICGKVVVATNEGEIKALDNLYERGLKNGLLGIVPLTPAQIKEREPHINGVKGLFVPQTGIIDYKAVSYKLRDLLIASGAKIFFNHKVIAIKRQANSLFVVDTSNASFTCKTLISCAGLGSDKVARMTHPKVPLRIIPFRGEYYTIKPEKHYLIKNLVYPVPDPAFPFLGVHFTRMIDGKVEAGPNAVLAFAREGYKKTDFNLCDIFETFMWPGFQKVAVKYWKMGMGEFYRSFYKGAFVKALQKLLPEIQSGDLIPGGAGIRAQASSRDGGLVDDFYFVEDKGLIHVCNAPSPAATASLAIGLSIAQKI